MHLCYPDWPCSLDLCFRLVPMVPSEFARIPSPKQAGQQQLSRKSLFSIWMTYNPNCLRGTKMHFVRGESIWRGPTDV